ncbi:uncharacterized protein LOC128214465 [Mya arenaria]|uniref:uncharacterized protein LOC128214465 n=1 Tax=Mya arenaria TaxID=6604 RepID=UPI0022DF58C1|nr:uncharacterized protein LOC128214465 [Mya arenaria]XP_052776909.1 uncharacterized protein LOC128214465 [Mya arenaria]XP_052776910.1 uncharacterized protein LOC128214465 [Mya arenaria]XP_052776911.1 uncharacterized protein LOC128214465 [Mya arenaria]
MSADTVRRTLPLVISSVAFVAFIVGNALFVNCLLRETSLWPWFMPCLGLVLLPSVILQLTSAVILLLDRGEHMSAAQSGATAVIHILQLGFLWRHIALWREVDPRTRSRDVTHLHHLQLLFTFTSIIPLFLIQTFIVIEHQPTHWVPWTALGISLFSASVYIAEFRHTDTEKHSDNSTCSVTNCVLRIVWRLGELIVRSISLSVFASVFNFWIFLILGLHALTMAVCLCTPVMYADPGGSRKSRWMLAATCTYMYTTVFVNVRSTNSSFRYCFFYVIMTLENAALTAVWYFHWDVNFGIISKNAVIIISGSALVISLCALIIYKTCAKKDEVHHLYTVDMHDSSECINCKLSVCSKHSKKLQRPFSAGWVTQYQKAAADGNYYKNMLHDSYLDSDVVSSADLLNSSGEHCQIRDIDVESVRPQTVAIQGSGTYTHKRFFDSNSSIANCNDTDSITSGSGVYDEDWRRKPDIFLSRLSAADALSLVSSSTHLLTDSWDSLLQQNTAIHEGSKHPKKIDILNSLIRKDLDSSFISDSYTSHHTLDSYQLPVTVLAKERKQRVWKRMRSKSYSTASDSTDCTICAFMRQNPSSPETSRRMSLTEGSVTESSNVGSRHGRRRDHSAYKRANKTKRRSRSEGHGHTSSERSYTHKYEKHSSRQSRKHAITSTSESSGHFSSSASVKKCKRTNINATDHTQHSSFALNNLNCKYSKETMQLSGFSDQNHRRQRSEVASDSGDSAFPRNTPVSDMVNPVRSKRTSGVPCVVSTRVAPAFSHAPHSKISAITKLPESIKSREPRGTDLPELDCNQVFPVSQDSGVSWTKALTAYLAATNNDIEGTSESSCEMII